MSDKKTVYFHADCLDGFGAAWSAWRKFGATARYRPLHHGQSWHEDEVADADVFVLDFSFPPSELARMAALARSVHQIDHHVSARDDWRGRLAPVAGDGREEYCDAGLRLAVSFDLDKSGARLAWEHFHPGEDVPLAIAHIEDQDLWRFRLEGTRAFCRALRLRPFDFDVWNDVAASADMRGAAYRALCAEGEAIERFLDVEVGRLAASAHIMPVTLQSPATGGMPPPPSAGLALNANTLFASELGHRLAVQSGSYGLVWQLGGDGLVRASLRACGQVDVAALAAHYGGGGHRNAAGFRMPWHRFAREVLGLREQEAVFKP